MIIKYIHRRRMLCVYIYTTRICIVISRSLFGFRTAAVRIVCKRLSVVPMWSIPPPKTHTGVFFLSLNYEKWFFVSLSATRDVTATRPVRHLFAVAVLRKYLLHEGTIKQKQAIAGQMCSAAAGRSLWVTQSLRSTEITHFSHPTRSNP